MVMSLREASVMRADAHYDALRATMICLRQSYGVGKADDFIKGACIGVVGFQKRDEFETFKKARSL